MADIGFTKKSFQLLKEIHDNNNREWYHENKDDLKEHLLQPFAEMLQKPGDGAACPEPEPHAVLDVIQGRQGRLFFEEFEIHVGILRIVGSPRRE